MKWPKQLTLLRHGESTYNELAESRMQDPVYRAFRQAFSHDWQSVETKKLAVEVAKILSKNNGEDSTALTEVGRQHALAVGKRLSAHISLPEVVYVSPYLRTTETLECLQQSWSALRSVRVIVEERIREQDFGLRLLYGDWRVMQVFHPEQRPLYAIQGDYWYRQPQGESIPDVRERNRSWMNSLARDWNGRNVLAITHHLNILAFRANVERLNPAQFLQLYKQGAPANCSLTQYVNQADAEDNEWFDLAYYNKAI